VESFSESPADQSRICVSRRRCIFFSKHGQDLVFAHAVKIIRHPDLAAQKAQSADRSGFRVPDAGHPGNRLARPGNNKRPALAYFPQQTREVRFGFVNINDFHDLPPVVINLVM
jgi:hypothetical protein